MATFVPSWMLEERAARSWTSVSGCRVTSMITPDTVASSLGYGHRIGVLRLRTHVCIIRSVLKVAGVFDSDTTTLRPPLNWSSGESDQYSTLSICSWSSYARTGSRSPHAAGISRSRYGSTHCANRTHSPLRIGIDRMSQYCGTIAFTMRSKSVWR